MTCLSTEFRAQHPHGGIAHHRNASCSGVAHLTRGGSSGAAFQQCPKHPGVSLPHGIVQGCQSILRAVGDVSPFRRGQGPSKGQMVDRQASQGRHTVSAAPHACTRSGGKAGAQPTDFAPGLQVGVVVQKHGNGGLMPPSCRVVQRRLTILRRGGGRIVARGMVGNEGRRRKSAQGSCIAPQRGRAGRGRVSGERPRGWRASVSRSGMAGQQLHPRQGQRHGSASAQYPWPRHQHRAGAGALRCACSRRRQRSEVR